MHPHPQDKCLYPLEDGCSQYQDRKPTFLGFFLITSLVCSLSPAQPW